MASEFQSWPKVLRHCGNCGNDHLAKDCPHKPAQTKTSLGMIGVIPSPSSSETETETIPLRVISERATKETNNQPGPTPTEEPVLQECAPGEKPKPKKRRSSKAKRSNKGKSKKNENSSGTDTSESGSWESIILETPDGTRQMYIV